MKLPIYPPQKAPKMLFTCMYKFTKTCHPRKPSKRGDGKVGGGKRNSLFIDSAGHDNRANYSLGYSSGGADLSAS